MMRRHVLPESLIGGGSNKTLSESHTGVRMGLKYEHRSQWLRSSNVSTET
jgi:hypothetical protein